MKKKTTTLYGFKSVAELTVIAVLVAILLLFGFFVPILGYPKIGVIEITTLGLFVIIGAVVDGPKAGTILGFVFGITSFLLCINGTSPFGAALLQLNAIFTLILCLVPRMLMGFLTGWLSKWLSSKKLSFLWRAGICSLAGALLNTILYMSALFLLFWNTDFIQSFGDTILIAFVALAGVNAIVEIVFNIVLGTAICRALQPTARRLKLDE